jgi:hypothetical protein
MNERQRLYLSQARSDREILRLLESQPVCHQLHYLQMLTEKLAKAYFWKDPGAAGLGHAAFVRFLRSVATNRRVAAAAGFPDLTRLKAWIAAVSDLANELERLAPARARIQNTRGPGRLRLRPRSNTTSPAGTNSNHARVPTFSGWST